MTEGKPPGMYLENGVWYIDKFIGGVRYRRSTGTADLSVATAILEDVVTVGQRRAQAAWRIKQAATASEEWRATVAQMESDPSSWLCRTARKVHVRGRNSGKGCTLTMEQLRDQVLASNGRCMITGLPFSSQKPEHAKAAPYGISIDRIDSREGYHADNIRVVCLAVNMAMREWGLDVLATIGKAFMLQQLQSDLAEVPIRVPGEIGKKETA